MFSAVVFAAAAAAVVVDDTSHPDPCNKQRNKGVFTLVGRTK